RDQVQVEVEHVLATRTPVRAEDVDRLRTRRAPDPRRDPLRDRQAVRRDVVRRVEERRVMIARDDQRVPRTQRLDVHERDRTIILVHQADHLLAVDDAAEDARLVDHGIISSGAGAEGACLPTRHAGSGPPPDVAARPARCQITTERLTSSTRGMSAVEHPTDTGASEATVAPILPLLLLESIRAHDRPREVLQNEDLASSLPRRLGLTGVVESRIRRYEEEQRRGRGVPLDDVLDLIRLVLRRPDAELILRQTGEELARRHFKRISAATVSALGCLPGTAGAAALRRAVRSMLRRATGASD